MHVEAGVGRPQVAYKETLTRSADGEGRYVRQSGGRGHYGHAKVHLHPGERGSGCVFENEIRGDTIPKEFIAPIDEGIREALTCGYQPCDPAENQGASASMVGAPRRPTPTLRASGVALLEPIEDDLRE